MILPPHIHRKLGASLQRSTQNCIQQCLAQLNAQGWCILPDICVPCIIQVAEAQAVAGRLANQLAPSATASHHALADQADDMADDEQQSLAHADGAQPGKVPHAETTAQRQGATGKVPSTDHSQPGRAAQKKVGHRGQRQVITRV